MIRMRSLLPRILAHVPSAIGFVAFWGICYVLSVFDLTGTQRIFAVSTLGDLLRDCILVRLDKSNKMTQRDATKNWDGSQIIVSTFFLAAAGMLLFLQM